MAGAGFRTFTAGEVLTAANTQNFLMDQSIMVFADTTARDAAITSPSEGMFAYLTGTNLLTFYNGSAWEEFTSGGGGVTVSATAPVSPDDGALWWDSDDGELYLYYNDGTSSQWVAAAGPSVTVAATAPTGYEGQLWLDSTDGSMYVYYTDPGGANAQWIGAVSRSGGLLQVVSTTKTDVFSASVAGGASVDVTGLSITHEVSNPSNKLLIMGNFGTAGNSVNVPMVGIGVKEDSTFLAVGDTSGSRNEYTAGGRMAGATDSSVSSPISFQFLHTPGAGSKTYQITAHNGRADTRTLYVNRSPADADSAEGARTVSTLTIMEVAG